jgi:hypothetical protein
VTQERLRTIALADAIRLCETLYTLVPFPNQWQGSEREQVIFGKGMVAGAKACAAALQTQTPERPMHITEITVSAGRVVNHPYEQYSNLRPQVTLKATVSAYEDPSQATKDLQSLAEQLVEDHKNAMLTSIRQLHRMAEREQEMARLSHLITREQERLNRLRAEVDSERSPLSLAAGASYEAREEDDDEGCSGEGEPRL